MRLLEKFSVACVVSLGVVAVGCTASVADSLHGFDAGGAYQGTGSSGSVGGSSSGSPTTSSGGCSACSTGDDATTSTGDDAGGTDPSSSSGAGDDGSAPSSSSSGVSGSSSGATGSSSGLSFPPITLPEGGLFGGSSGGTSSGTPSDDGGANSCTSKLCIDPVFDCPLQGCFNGCTNFHCM